MQDYYNSHCGVLHDYESKNTYVCIHQMQSCKRHELHFQLCHTHSSLVRELLQHRCHQASGWHHTLWDEEVDSI